MNLIPIISITISISALIISAISLFTRRGEKGDKGDPGPMGPQGLMGESGCTDCNLDKTVADFVAYCEKTYSKKRQKKDSQ